MSKRQAAGVVIAIHPSGLPVLASEVMKGATGAVLTPAIAAITLALVHKEALGERLGHNVRYAALGSVAAALMGAVGTRYSHRATLYLAAAAGFAALPALLAIRPADLAAAATRTDRRAALPRHLRPRQDRGRDVVCDACLLNISLCVGLFFLGSAGLFPLAAAAIARAGWLGTETVVAAGIIVPQLIASAVSPRIGILAGIHGRRLVLMVGFAAMVLRPLLLALDGISAAVIGVLIPLTVADITHRRGRLDLAMGVVGLFMGLASAASTAIGGAIATNFGTPAAFRAAAAAGLLACLPASLDFAARDAAPFGPAPGLKEPSCRSKSPSARRNWWSITPRPSSSPTPTAKSPVTATRACSSATPG